MRKIIDRQLQKLIKEAPQYNVSALVMEKAIVPVLRSVVKELKHSEYFILQNQQGDLLLRQIVNNDDPSLEKTVIYCFATLQDALSSDAELSLEVTGISLPVAELLLRLFSAQKIDSIIFMDASGDRLRGKELDRKQMESSIEAQIKANFSKLPTNLA